MGANSMGFAHCIGVDQEVNCCATYHCNKCGSEALVAMLDGTTLTKYIRVLSPHKDSLVILASPPCQTYSNRGHHGGLTDVRDGLPFLLKLCIAIGVMPIALAIENVPQVLTKHRKHFEAFVQSMSEHGYDHNVDQIDARHFSIAQRRKRIIAIFVRKQLPYDQVQASKITQLAFQKGMLQADGKTSLQLVKTTTDHEAVTAGRVLTDRSLWIGSRPPDAQPTLSFLTPFPHRGGLGRCSEPPRAGTTSSRGTLGPVIHSTYPYPT
jgi:site-specific DNA-cytosine methylase